MSKEQKNDIAPVEFKLDRDHTHRGEDYAKGKTITLRKHQADRLSKEGVGTIVKTGSGSGVGVNE